MRLLAWLFQGPLERSLPEGAYDRPADPDQLRAEIKARVKLEEARSFMLSEVDSLVARGLPVTIRNVEDDHFELTQARKRAMDRTEDEFIRDSALGATLLKDHLVRSVS